MLLSRNLDDQRFEDIVREAVGRLPWLCPAWTDHNSHDPGITILELMAWFKETQQYQINWVGPETARKLLELTGIRLRPERAAECALFIPPDSPGRALYAALETPEGVVFELSEEIPQKRTALLRALIARPGGRDTVDVTGMLRDDSVFRPFAFGGEQGSALLLDFTERPEKTLRLWFRIEEPAGSKRNEPDEETELPRTLAWEMSGVGKVTPLQDETLALSRSGYVTLPAPESWRPETDGAYRLRLRLEEAGCEESVRLNSVSVSRYRATQTESRARSYRFTVNPEQKSSVEVRSAQAHGADPAVFLRTKMGWEQVSSYELRRGADGLRITLNAEEAAVDGETNLLVACLDPVRLHDLLFDATGRPGESFRLNLGGKRVLTERLTLMCQTLCEDGAVRPAIWRCVDDLAVCGPRDRVFQYDRKRELLTVGDGARGALIAPGNGAVMVIEELVSLCGEGNIPANARLRFTEDGMETVNTAAYGGCEAETLSEGRGRLLRRLQQTRKCVSAKDYEFQAMNTPGLRMAGARAIPGYDVRRKHQKTPACVSVAVLPAADNEKPVPDERFLAAVSRQLERCRSVCVRAEAIPVRYAEMAVRVDLWAEKELCKETVEDAMRSFFAPRRERIGAPADSEELAAFLQKLPGARQINTVEMRALDQNSYQTSGGDLTVMPDTILHLARVTVNMAKD
ncbi:MAG: putative baseplate assembly protein [Oscillospiraceae bacterium]|nr:putative baseplate assembly protein [Oscillospiraceae bacterium]